MGVDVVLVASDPINEIPDERITWINKRMEALFDGGDEYDRFVRVDEQAIKWRTLRRYYGEYYERGNFKDIYLVYRLIKYALPDCHIHYHGDSGPFYEEDWRDYEPNSSEVEKTLEHFFEVGHGYNFSGDGDENT